MLAINFVSSERGTDEMSENREGASTGSYTTEQRSFTGKSIRDRIAALSAAAGVSGLDSSPVREKIKNTLMKAVSASSPSICDKKTSEDEQTCQVTEIIINKEETVKSAAVKQGVAFDVDFGKPFTNYAPAGFLSTVESNNAEGERQNTRTESPVVGVARDLKEKGVAFDVDFGKAVTNRPPAHFLSKRGGYKFVGKSENNRAESPVVGVTSELKEKGVAFEVAWNGEQRSVCSRGQSALVQSPFTVHKKLAKAKNHQAVLSEPEHLKADLTVRKDVKHQDDCGPQELLRVMPLKRNTYTINTLSSPMDWAIKEGMTGADVLHDAGDGTQRFPHSNRDTTSIPNETRDKRNTFILDDEARAGGTVQLGSNASQKRNTFNLENGNGNDLSLRVKSHEAAIEDDSKLKSFQADFGTRKQSAPKRNTFSLDTESHVLENVFNSELPVIGLLNDLSTADCKQRASQTDFETSWQTSDASQKRNTFTLDKVSQCLDNPINSELPVAGVLHTLAKEDESKMQKMDSGTVSQAADSCEKRNEIAAKYLHFRHRIAVG